MSRYTPQFRSTLIILIIGCAIVAAVLTWFPPGGVL